MHRGFAPKATWTPTSRVRRDIVNDLTDADGAWVARTRAGCLRNQGHVRVDRVRSAAAAAHRHALEGTLCALPVPRNPRTQGVEVMRELELRRILWNVAAVTAVTVGMLTMPHAIRAQQVDDPTPVQGMEREMEQVADDVEDEANWGWLGLLGLAGLLGLRRRDDTRTIETDTRRF
jgi:MYXO-CTERM domain-containing protein